MFYYLMNDLADDDANVSKHALWRGYMIHTCFSLHDKEI